jgi:hypothetical protein
MQLLAQQASRAGANVPSLRGIDLADVSPYGGEAGGNVELVDGDRLIRAVPVRVIVGVPGVAPLAGLTIQPVPTPGSWYRVQPGDNLLDIAKQAYGKGLPGARWIASAKSNAAQSVASDTEFEKKYLGPRTPQLLPRWAADGSAVRGVPGSSLPLLWIPEGEGLEAPAEDLEEEPTPGPTPPEPPPVPPIPQPTPPPRPAPPEPDDAPPVPPPSPPTPQPTPPREPSKGGAGIGTAAVGLGLAWLALRQ